MKYSAKAIWGLIVPIAITFINTNATGNWETWGGTLDTFTEAGRAGGGGDGVFNLDSPSYKVVVAMAARRIARPAVVRRTNLA